MVEKMIKAVNEKINLTVGAYALTHTYDAIANAEVRGMLSMLQLATGKEYYYDESGVHERV